MSEDEMNIDESELTHPQVSMNLEWTTLVEAGGAVRRRGRGFQSTGESTNSVFLGGLMAI